MNKDSHLYRSGTTKAKIFDYKEDFDEAPKDEAPNSVITKGGRYELLKQ